MIEELGTIGKILIPKKVKDQIDFLHKKVGGTEWSGILVYKHTRGSISKMNNLVFKVSSIFLMDIGTGASTGFEYNADDVVALYDDLDEAMESNIGLIHTHHSMGAYHSNTDMKELEENTDKYNYYVSLVVDFKEEYKCKIGFPSKTKQITTSYVRNTVGDLVKVNRTVEKDIILLGDLDVGIQNNVKLEDWFVKRLTKVEDDKKAKSAVKTYKGYSNVNSYKGWEHKDWNRKNWVDEEIDHIKEFNNQRDDLLKKYLVSLMNLDSDIENYSFYDEIVKFGKLEKEDVEIFIDSLEPQVEIIHDNVYGVNQVFLLETHLKQVIELLSPYKHNTNIPLLIKELTECTNKITAQYE